MKFLCHWHFRGLKRSTILPGVFRAAPTVAIVSILGTLSAAAQGTGRGGFTGVVHDPAGASIPGAKITVTNMATNVSVNSVSNSTGFFEVDSLDPGIYQISINADGFEQLLRKGVTLTASSLVNVPITLSIGQSQQTVTVTADAPLLNTETGLNGQVLTTVQLQTLPVSGNNPMQFAEIAPGVQSPGGVSQTYSMVGTLGWNGVSKFGTAGVANVNEFSLDGAANEGNQRGNAVSLNTDQVGELRIDTTAFDPTIGHTMGVTTTHVTKNGTNDLHGSATHMYQNRRWAAMQRFQGLTYKAQLLKDGCFNGPSSCPLGFYDENKYGWPGVHENLTTYGIGGPVFIPKLYDGRNKFFFFVSGTNDIYSDAQPTTATIPTLQQRTGDFSDLPTSSVPANYASTFANACPGNSFYGQYQIYDPYSVVFVNGRPSRAPICGNKLPASRMLNPTMAGVINKLLPAPTAAANVLAGNYAYTSVQPQTFRQFTTREDYAFSERDRIFVRFTRQHYTKAQPGIATDGSDTQQGPKWIEIGALGWNHVFSPSTNMDVTLGGSNYETSFTNYPGYSKYPPSSLGLPSYTDQYAAGGPTMPQLTFGGTTYAQGGSGANNSLFGQLNNFPSFYRTANIRVNLTHVGGQHTLRAGGEWRQQNYSRGVQGNISGIYAFDNSFTQQNDGSNSDCTTGGGTCNLGLPTPSNVGLSYASFLMGVQSSATVNQQAPVSVSTPYYSGYVGDAWRITPKLTLMPGLRFEYEFGPKEKHNYQIALFDPNAQLPISTAASAAYTAMRSNATAPQQAVLPASISVQGGPVYAGVNGAPERQWINSYRFLPRIGFAYLLEKNTVLRGGYGLFFDTLNALEEPGTTDQTNFTATTGDSTSAFYGQYGQNLNPGAPPITDPFPVQNGNRFVPALGTAVGALSYAGANPTVYDYNLVPARAQRVALSVQHQFGGSLVVEVGYIGSWTTHVSSQSGGIGNQGGAPNVGNQNLAAVPSSFFSGAQTPNTVTNSLLSQQVTNPFQLANFSSLQGANPAAYTQLSHQGRFTNSTMSVGDLVRPYSFMGGLSMVRAIGASHFHELQVNVTKRLTNGFSLMVAYQKNYQYDKDYFANSFDTQMSWEPSNNSSPQRLTAEGLYQLPFGRNKTWANSGWKSALFGGFVLSSTWEVQPGNLIQFGNLFYVGDIRASDIKLKKPLYHTDIPGNSFYIQWLNPGNVTATVAGDGTCSYSGTGFVTNASCQPNGYNLRAFPTRVDGVRQMGSNVVLANIKREFPITERVHFEARFDVYNLFNRQLVGAPSTTVTSPQFGQVTANGSSNGAGNARWLDIQGHISF